MPATELENCPPNKTPWCLVMSKVYLQPNPMFYEFSCGYGLGTDKVNESSETVIDLETLTDLTDDAFVNDNHCFRCTAGIGSS